MTVLKASVLSTVTALTLGLINAGNVYAQQVNDVIMSTIDGGLIVNGKFLRIEKGAYVVDKAALGIINFNIDTTNCPVFGCPTLTSASNDLQAQEYAIYGSRTIGTTLIPNLLRGYAETLCGRMEMREDSPTQRDKLKVGDGP